MSRLLVSALVAGALFGLGLAMSGMTDARIVLGFLDVAGAFDPTLMFVLAGAVATTALLFTPILRRGHPLFACAFQVSNLKHIDAPLLTGAALFGIGWGIAGYCPGPALAGLGAGSLESLWFVPAMLAGSLLHRLLFR
ncbi:DUF6691 family protein [Dokdonella sp.]|jgi:uncharacterized protein|uniref:DUF6691 family protein n=1 Tax=Dokdonella sp. TaxID=2291710 RepID=UPI002CE50F0D|nr:YeeE/YedE family protein [Rhodanobacteraceae bacterium]HQV50158.1 YeeE/YedE family protein [Dokdonella sp.]